MNQANEVATRAIEIECVTRANKFDPAAPITHVGGTRPCRWKITEDKAIRCIDRGEWAFFIRSGGRALPVTVARNGDGSAGLRAALAPEGANRLLDLPPCL